LLPLGLGIVFSSLLGGDEQEISDKLPLILGALYL
jgi:hypothetical protein